MICEFMSWNLQMDSIRFTIGIFKKIRRVLIDKLLCTSSQRIVHAIVIVLCIHCVCESCILCSYSLSLSRMA